MSETDKLAQGMTLKDVRDWHRGCQQAAEADGHDRSAECHKELADAIDAHLAHASAQPAQPASVADGWIDGEPPHPWNKEWFIAVTTDGDRVVLRALPKEYTYDYTTADATYLKAAKIKKWMQFPDSEFVPAPQPQSAMAQESGE